MKLIVLIIPFLLYLTFGYKILCVFPTPTRSHQIIAKGVVNSLLSAGHEVTLANPYNDWKPNSNLTVIHVDTRQLIDALDMTDPKNNAMRFVLELTGNISTITSNNRQLRETLVKEQFDAVFTEYFMVNSDAGYAAVQQVPWFLLSTVFMHPYLEAQVDEVRSIATNPLMMTKYPIPMSFIQRLVNTGAYCLMLAFDWLTTSVNRARYEEQFGPLAAARGIDLPPLNTALSSVSILFVNSDPSIAPVLSLPPNVVNIAGFHIDENIAPLPKELQDLLDSSPQGVVYFSLGSLAKSSVLPEYTRRDLIQVFGQLPYTVLWKYETKIEGVPKNVHVRPWWPQSSVLAHPNVKIFISHCGLLSLIEAVHTGVPLIAVPVFADQPNNAAIAVNAGYALQVTFSTDMGRGLKAALEEIIRDDSYYKRAKYVSKLFRNRPVAPSKLISHYVKLAIDTQGAHHLRSNSLLYPWYQRWMLDQISALLVFVYILLRIIRKLLTIILVKPIKVKNKSTYKPVKVKNN